MNVRVVVALCFLQVACSNPTVEDCTVDPIVVCAGRTCGALETTDLCGEPLTVECGTCDPALTCSAVGQCIDPSCTPESDAELCALGSFECDVHERTDGCDQVRSIDCGACDAGLVCSAIGQCIDEACVPESDAELCARAGVTCGGATATDNCGQTRTATCGAPCPVVGDPGWFGEFEVDDPAYSRARESMSLHVVDVGTHYLAVWEDGRGDGSGWAASEPIVAARVTYDGEVLDPGGIMLAEPGTNLTIDGLLYDGTEVVLVMTEYVDETTRIIALLRLGADGRPLAPRTDVVTDDLFNTVAAFDGTNIVLAWISDEGATTTPKVQAITPGTLALGPVHDLSTNGFSTQLSLAVREGRSMLAWEEWRQATSSSHFMTSMLAADYSPSVPGGVEVTDTVGPLSNGDHTLFATSAGYALLHQHKDSATQRLRLDATFFDADGAAIDGSLALHERMTMWTGESYYATAASIGSSWIVIATVADQRQGFVIDAETRTIAAGPIPLEDAGFAYGQIFCHSAECTISIEAGSFRQARMDTYTPALARTGSVYPALVAQNQYRSDVAFDGTQYAVMWSAGPNEELSGTELRVRRMSHDGRWLDGAPILVPLAAELRWSFGIEAYPGGGFLLRWIEDDPTFSERYYVRRLNADGTWAWPAAVRLDLFSSWSPQFGDGACAGDRCLVTFVRTSDRWEYLVVGGDGTELTEPAIIPGVWSDRVVFDVHYDGASTFWLAFTYEDSIQVRTISAAADTIGQAGTEAYQVRAVEGVYRGGPVIWQRFGSETLLLSSASVPDETAPDGRRVMIEARTLVPGTGLSEPTTIADDPIAPHALVGAVTNGDELEVVYLAVSPLFFPTGSLEQLYSARYDRTLGIVDPGSALMPAAWFGDAVMASGGDRALLSYSRIDWDVGFGDERVRATFVGNRSTLLSDDAVCAHDGQCAGGRCRALQCCDECSLWKGL